MRQVKASEVTPGMKIQFDLSGWDVKGAVATVDVRPHAVWIYTEQCCEMSLDLDSPVTVLSEPQPAEPTAFGAKVIVDGEKFLRAQHPISVPVPWLSESDGTWRNWATLLRMGQVTVVPDQGWTIPDDTPEVPERIEEWPEDDKALREYEWLDSNGRPWMYSWTYGRWYTFSRTAISKLVTYEPKFGPWTRVSDA